MSWVAWSLVALALWGAWTVLNKLALRSLGWPHLVIASWCVSTVVVLALLARGVSPRALWSRDGALALAAAAASLLAVIAFYLALRSGPVAMVTPLSSLYPAVAALLAILVLGERPGLLQWVGLALGAVAGFLLARP